MVGLAMVNMLILLVGFLSGLRKKGPEANQEMNGNSTARETCAE